MMRETLVVICFFVIVLLAAQEHGVQIEAYCEKQSHFFPGDKCNDLNVDELCSIICVTKENSVSGSCKSLRCICATAC
ncbi:defensin 1-like [Trifolium pratense]|uniref:defensin 1-like n=1 Tax=Trifolium pratense TaxID=57577 RepID=UPI001E6908B7|nr:defensin 1-like [Trifolium pratense]XP_045790706.1 defensin 1-like [Trifolium pratense]